MEIRDRSILHQPFIYGVLLFVITAWLFAIGGQPTHAATGINQEINFQGRLLTSEGATVPDGFYNIQFKIYQDGDGQSAGNTTGSPAGSLLWTESHLNNDGNGVTVKNGFLSVQLGSVNPFGSSIDWNQDTLWLSMNVGNTNTTCTPFSNCSPDGEMLPMKRLSSTPYAQNAYQLGGREAGQFVQLDPGGTPQVVNSSNAAISVNQQGVGDIISLQDGGVNVLTVQDGGNVGIGTSSPSEKLSVAGSTQSGSIFTESDTLVDADGSTTTGSGTAASITENAALVAIEAADGVCTDSLTNPTNVFTDSGADCDVDDGDTHTAILGAVPAGDSTTAADATLVTTEWAMNEDATADGAYTDGDDLYIDTFADLTYNSGRLGVGDNTPSYLLTVGSGDLFGVNDLGYLVFEGATNDSNQLTVAPADVGQDSTITIPDPGVASDTLCLQTLNNCGDGTGVTTVGSIDSESKSNDGAVISGTTIYLQTADASYPGLVSTGTQTFAGAKTFTGTVDVQNSFTADDITVDAGDITFGSAANRNILIAQSAADTIGRDLTISAGTAGTSGTAAYQGGGLKLQGGDAAGTGNANGGDVTLSGGAGVGAGVKGLVIIDTPTITTAATQNCSADCTITQANIDSNGSVAIDADASGITITLPDPTNVTAGRIIYVTAANGSEDFVLEVNGGGTGNEIAMRQSSTATMMWNGTEWTAAGASSSTTLQSAYDNTLQSAGGAELVVSQTSNTNGLTIRDSSVNPVNGRLFSVQTSSAAGLLSVDSDVAEYASNGGAEVAGSGGASTFPASTWESIGSATVSRYTTTGDFIATGQGSAETATTTTANDGVKNTLNATLIANTTYNVSFAARLSSGTFTDLSVYYSVDGSAASVECASSQDVATSVWRKINCSFTAPSSGITSSNAIFIRQTGSGTARTFYVDNLSVTIAADYNYATDGGVDDSGNFSTNWTAVSGSTVSHSTSVGNDASTSAEVVTSGTTGEGIRNILSVDPLPDTLYRVTVYSASTTSGFDNFTVRYSRDGGTNFVGCADYNTQTVSSSLTNFTEITCYIKTDGTSATSPYVYFTQTDSVARTFYVDTFSMSLSDNTTPNVQVGGGNKGGPVTLFTFDRAASAPIASNYDALLGSMYYDTSLGKLQCYEADGWGACGSSPDEVVTISPEYTNAVLHGTGVGTMTSDLCSDVLGINDGSNGQPTICDTNETYNFYRWTSPQASAQTYSVYVTYQLPSTFKSFLSGQTSVMGRTDSSNATVEYQIYRQDPSSGLSACGSTVSVSTGSVSSWQTGVASGASDPSACTFQPGNSIVFKIDVIASQSANAYIGNLNFTYNNN